VVVRPYLLADFSRCVAAHQGRLPKVNKFDHDLPPSKSKDKHSFRQRVLRYRKNAGDQSHYVFGVFAKESGDYVGQVDLLVIQKQLRWGNLGYQMHNQHWGKGYATDAAAIALKIAFRDLNFHRIEAGAEPANKASIKVAKNAGLIYEGLRRKFLPDGGGTDLVFFATNAFDFKKLK
jgi:RimJ/RimL family protein N-acetyltransferase